MVAGENDKLKAMIKKKSGSTKRRYFSFIEQISFIEFDKALRCLGICSVFGKGDARKRTLAFHSEESEPERAIFPPLSA